MKNKVLDKPNSVSYDEHNDKKFSDENKKSQNVHNFQKSKKDFFDLAGKIKLDKDEVTAFRKESLV